MSALQQKNLLAQRREALLESVQTLPDEALQELTTFVEYLQHRVKVAQKSQPVEENILQQRSAAQKTTQKSAYEIVKDSGFIGCAEGPPDLAANHKAYLEEHLTKKYDRD